MYFCDRKKLTRLTPPENKTIVTLNIYIAHDYSILSDCTMIFSWN